MENFEEVGSVGDVGYYCEKKNLWRTWEINKSLYRMDIGPLQIEYVESISKLNTL